MKKLVILLLLLSCSLAQAAYKDGIYEGEGKGNAGVITSTVVIKDGKIESIKLEGPKETPMLFAFATEDIVPKIKSNGKVPVETVAGATNSSRGILEATKNALNKAQ